MKVYPMVKYQLQRRSWFHLQRYSAKMIQKKFSVKTLSMMKIGRYFDVFGQVERKNSKIKGRSECKLSRENIFRILHGQF